jgi:hypothetical protein
MLKKKIESDVSGSLRTFNRLDQLYDEIYVSKSISSYKSINIIITYSTLTHKNMTYKKTLFYQFNYGMESIVIRTLNIPRMMRMDNINLGIDYISFYKSKDKILSNNYHIVDDVYLKCQFTFEFDSILMDPIIREGTGMDNKCDIDSTSFIRALYDNTKDYDTSKIYDKYKRYNKVDILGSNDMAMIVWSSKPYSFLNHISYFKHNE